MIGRASIYGRRSKPETSEKEMLFPGAGPVFDSSTQRMFAVEGFSNRILVFPASPEQLSRWPQASVTDSQAATVVIGQADFSTAEMPRTTGWSPRRTSAIGGAVIDETDQRLFVVDRPSQRILVFDIHPDRLKSDPEAALVIGQADFNGKTPGSGPSKFMGVAGLAYDAALKRLFVADRGNNRILIFDADPGRLRNGAEAVAVMGQPDFNSKLVRTSLDQIEPGPLGYDWRYHRLFVTESLNHRIMVYDGHPDRIGGPATAIATIGQPDMESIHPAVSQTRVAMPRINVDSRNQKLYVSEGFPAGNRIVIFDISPENLKTGMAAVDVVGHETPDGEADFNNRMAQGHLDGQSLAAPRSVVIDPIDHRLFVGDEYNHRVAVWQLDELNRIVDYDAKWVLGQPDINTSLMGVPTARNMTVPLAVAYDTASKRLFVGDGYHNRVLVYEAAPGQLQSGMAASHVIGQKDFTSTVRAAGKAGIDFDVRMGRGIASTFLPMGLAVDEAGQRLFVADGKNNRVLVHDIRREVMKNGPEAIGVIGQPDFDSIVPQEGARGLSDPGHLTFDPVHQRLFVVDYQNTRVLAFDVDKRRFTNGAAAVAVLGQVDFSTNRSVERNASIDGRHIYSPNGIAFDPGQQLLYVADGGGTYNMPADRVLVFDADPGRLRNGAEAVEVIGAQNAESPAADIFGGPRSYPGQFTIRDTRGIALDPLNGRLFTTGSFESRVVAFYFPRASWRYRIGVDAVQSFATLDAVDPGSQQDPETVRTMTIESAGTMPQGISVYRVTEPFMDTRTQRHSRMLISEATVPAATTLTEATLFIKGETGRHHTLSLYNPGGRESTVDFVLIDQDGREQHRWQTRVKAGEQMLVSPETVTDRLDTVMSLHSKANRPVSVTALSHLQNGRGETLISPVPLAQQTTASAAKIIPVFVNGGKSRSELVLINPTDIPMRGSVTFFDANGSKRNFGTASDYLGYFLPPHSAQFIPGDGAGPRAEQGYALLEAAAGQATPYAATRVQRHYGDVLGSESLIEGTIGEEIDYAIDLRATPVRHGETDTRLVFVNPNSDVARVDIKVSGRTLFSERVNGGQQRVVDLRELAGDFDHGILHVTADPAIVVAAQQRTVNLRAETIESGLPPVVEGSVFPYVANGGGVSTEIRLANTTSRSLEGQMGFRQADGQAAQETILR